MTLLDKYVDYFNRRRNAGIDCIGNRIDDPTNRIPVIRYKDGHEVELDVLNWKGLFEKLEELHPRPIPRHSDPPAQERRTGTASKRQHGAS